MPNSTKHLRDLTKVQSSFLQRCSDQPVDWWIWSSEAFSLAVDERKPILLTLGSCDVDSHSTAFEDCFEDEQVAALLKKNFVCVCVDSDEHPDVSEVFLEAVRVMNGGFARLPLAVFLTPEGLPFHGGWDLSSTGRFGKPSFFELCSSVSSLFTSKRDELEKRAARLIETIARATSAHSLKGLEEQWDDPALTADKILRRLGDAARQCTDQLEGVIDREHGGFRSGAGKEVHACWLPALLLAGDRKKSAAVLLSLEKMRCAAVHDPVEGGFFFCTQDSRWMRPRFKKSLTDNVQLLVVYAQASAMLRKANPVKADDFESTAREIFDFLECRLKCSDTGLYFSGEADESGDQISSYYGQEFAEFEKAFSAEPELLEFATACFGLTRKGLSDGVNVLSCPPDFSGFCKERGLALDVGERLYAQSVQRFREMRAQRAPVSRRSMIILSENALVASSLLRAAQVLGDSLWLERGLQILAQLEISFVAGAQSVPAHMLAGNQPSGLALASDYAFWLQASVDAYCLTGEQTYANRGRELVKGLHVSCVDPALGILFAAPVVEHLFNRPLSTTDSTVAAAPAVVFASCRTFLAVERAAGALERRESAEVKMWEALELVALSTFARSAQTTPLLCSTGLAAVSWAQHQSVCSPDHTSLLPGERWLAATRRFWEECLSESQVYCVLSHLPSVVAVDEQATTHTPVVAASDKPGDTLPAPVALVLSNVGGCYESTIKYVDMVDKLRNHPIQEG